MLIDRNSIRQRWRDLLANATQIDIAVAWITSDALAEDLLQFATIAGHQIRIISGYHDYLTSPVALRRLHASNLVKIGATESGWRFHPKVYLFTTKSETVCWIGSANLTDAGFGRNIELVYECVDDGSARAWIDDEWGQYEYPTTEWLDQYEKGWRACRAKEQLLAKVPPLSPPGKKVLPASLMIALRSKASKVTVEPLLLNARSDPRIVSAPDFQSMWRELLEVDFRAVSVQSFLWLVGWCNTGGTYQESSDTYMRVLTREMFGYIPGQFLIVEDRNINLKRYRYRAVLPTDVVDAVVKYHRNNLS